MSIQLHPNRFLKDGPHWAEQTPLNVRIEWNCFWAKLYFNSTTREERINAYRLKGGENVRYYDTYGWPKHF